MFENVNGAWTEQNINIGAKTKTKTLFLFSFSSLSPLFPPSPWKSTETTAFSQERNYGSEASPATQGAGIQARDSSFLQRRYRQALEGLHFSFQFPNSTSSPPLFNFTFSNSGLSSLLTLHYIRCFLFENNRKPHSRFFLIGDFCF